MRTLLPVSNPIATGTSTRTRKTTTSSTHGLTGSLGLEADNGGNVASLTEALRVRMQIFADDGASLLAAFE